MCMMRGCRFSDSFITAIGEQIAFRRPVLAPSLFTLKTVTVVLLRGEQCLLYLLGG